MAVFRIDRFRPDPAAADALRARLAPIFAPHRRARVIDPRLIRLAEIVLVIAIGVQIASVFWSLAGPVSRPSATPRASAAPVTAPSGPVDPFRMAASDIVGPPPAGDLTPGPDLAETTLNLVLHGTWVTEGGGAAFIKTPDEKQGRFAVGDTITSGVTLESVHRDQVVINRGGVRESLRLINRDQVAPPRAAVAAPADNKIASDVTGLATIGDQIVAKPELDDAGNVRLVLHPAGDHAAFEALGLRAGDKLVAIDNHPLGVDIATNLATLERIRGKRNMTISVERDGVVLPIAITRPAPGVDD